ncbi:MAG: Isoprenyl transferase [Candidatus Woesebacteria bacterium GW2011_GWA1_44_23]|uniref:Isoprenyl transferase n=1 Tax=Candidatus Woesebacteria bacterium GW2011_GWA1_44_23 TaxID=1618558 RepID=A0A837I9D3_9BACT|nr:MAG: Isoprenyl transferase [Candidatus Woesebacteria bacterium GW2011_GWA1_44_23]
MDKVDNLALPRGTIVPDHIAIILDGNRRWARSRGLPTLQGHLAGFEAGLKIAKAARSWGVHTFTVWGLSTENWDRSPKELAYLMKLYWKMVSTIEEEAKKDDIRFVHLGRKDRIPKSLALYIRRIEEKTKNNKSHVFNAAIDYGGHDEILRTTRKIIDAGIKSSELDEKTFASFLDTGDQPYPYVDLFIRTSGEQRTSGFLPWQLNYAEYYWELDHLPDMTPEKLRNIILDFSRRRRRFGGNDTAQHIVFNPGVTARLEIDWWRLGNIPTGVRIRDYAMKHLREQYGLSKKLAFEAAKYLIEAVAEEKDEKWDKATERMKKFYELIKGEVKLAFEPKIVASLEVDFARKMEDKDSVASASEAEGVAREHLVKET